MLGQPQSRTLADHFRRQSRPNYSWKSAPLIFADVKPYRAFWVEIDGQVERWLKIPESAGVNATRSGGGKSTRFFFGNQVIVRVGFD